MQGGTIGHERGGSESTEASVGGVVGEIGEDPAGDYAERVKGGETARGFSGQRVVISVSDGSSCLDFGQIDIAI